MNPTEHEIAEFVREALTSASSRVIDEDRTLEDNGVDSLATIEWLYVVEERFGVVLLSGDEAQNSLESGSVGEIVRAIIDRVGSS